MTQILAAPNGCYWRSRAHVNNKLRQVERHGDATPSVKSPAASSRTTLGKKRKLLTDSPGREPV